MSNNELSLDSIVKSATNQVSSQLEGEYVILDVASGTYYGLDEVGASVWSSIQEQKSVGEVRDIILAQYDVTPHECEGDLMELLEQLQKAGLVEIVHESAG